MPTPETRSTEAAAPAGRFRLLDDFQASYLKFNGREPRTLQELALARAERNHRIRLAEIKAMAPKLALLDELLPALAARGVTLSHRDAATLDGGKTLRVMHAFGADNKFCEALMAVGFKEIDRRDSFRDEQTVTLKHGRSLLIQLDVKKPAATTAAEATPS